MIEFKIYNYLCILNNKKRGIIAPLNYTNIDLLAAAGC